MKEMNYKLDIQLFAEDAPVVEPQTQVTEPTSTQSKPSYTQEQLDEIAEARATRASDAALKDFFKKQGMEEDEIKEALAKYKGEKQAKQPDVSSLNIELETSKKDAADAKLQNKAILTAVKLGVEVEQIPYVLKLAEIANDDPTDEQIKAAIETVLTNVPGFKAQKDPLPRFAKGTSQNPAKPLTEQQEYLENKYKGNKYYRGNK